MKTPAATEQRKNQLTFVGRCVAIAVKLNIASGLLLVGAACAPTVQPSPPVPTNQNRSNANTSGLSGQIRSFLSDVQLSGNQMLSLFYDVSPLAESVTAFYVEVADSGPGAPEIGAQVEIGTNLPTGTMQRVDFTTGSIPRGVYRLGIQAIAAGNSIRLLSIGTLQIQGPPDPVFISPISDTTGQVGIVVDIRFDVRDPEGVVQWRLFFESASSGGGGSVPIDQRGTQLSVGSGNAGVFPWDTSDFPPGTYLLGVSATDSGASIAATVAAGNSSRIVTAISPITITLTPPPPPLMPPTLIVSQPSAALTVFGTADFTVVYDGVVNEPGATGSVTLFYDLDRMVDVDEVELAADRPVAGSITFSTSDFPAAGTYNLGATIDDGINPPVSAYAAGAITYVTQAQLTVSEPSADRTVPPGSLVDVGWTTNLPVGAALVDVFAQSDANSDGTGEGPEIAILAASAVTTTSATFDTAGLATGRYVINVRLTFSDGTTAPIVQAAPGFVRVSTLPPMFWLGALASQNNTTALKGAIFGGANFEDNAGTSFAAAGDLDGDNFNDFLINSRYGKPFFNNPTGIGHGEAYLIHGSSARFTGEYSLNSVGIPMTTDPRGIRGVIFAGVRTPQGNFDTDGIASMAILPDIDGDEFSEIAFGFPRVASRGHNADATQAGIVGNPSIPSAAWDTNYNSLEKSRQFLRGGIVVVSSSNAVISDPFIGVEFGLAPVVNLDLVGQDFTGTEPLPGAAFLDVQSINMMTGGCQGGCGMPMGGNGTDALNPIGGFVNALADCYDVVWRERFTDQTCTPLECNANPTCAPFSPNLTGGVVNAGFYPSDVIPFEGTGGYRILGIGQNDRFGSSITVSNSLNTGTGDLIISAPGRTARGILLDGGQSGSPTGGEVDGLESPPGTGVTRPDAGVAYLFDHRQMWTPGPAVPKPFQYMVGAASHCGNPSGAPFIPNIDALRIAGFSNEMIENVMGIPDFNSDGRNDFAVGAPLANDEDGKLYVVFRREEAIEGDFVLEKLALSPSDPQRLDGVLIIGNPGSEARLGTSIATGLDFNGDDITDIVVSAPNVDNATGEVYVIFGGPSLTSPANGLSLDGLLLSNPPRAARLVGNQPNGMFGFNVANAGDVDGDGTNDLLIAAPNASPFYDSNPNDFTDSLTSLGVDVNGDGVKDDVSGPLGRPDGLIDDLDNLDNAGVVFLVLGLNTLSGSQNISALGTTNLRGAIIVGRRGHDTANNHLGDRLGGGDAGNVSIGGIMEKVNRGRSTGLASAGDVDGDGKADFLLGSILANARLDGTTGVGVRHAGEAYLIYGFAP